MFETEFAIERNKLFMLGKKTGTGIAFLLFISMFYLIFSFFHKTTVMYYQVISVAVLLYLIIVVISLLIK